ncbi:hypothetical protein [Hydrocarboniphaga effusa]|uniref:hypothetical protein n=1 Tax=Hydrocarboniphaga effusa TaxID=243629 RepID=UPI003BA97A33
MTQADAIEIALPITLGVREALALSEKLAALPAAEAYVFNFASMGRIEPFGSLIASDVIDRFRRNHPRARFKAKGHEHCGYAAHIGFFKAFGLKFGKAPGEATGSESYLPIDFVDCEELRQRAADEYAEVGEFIDGWAGKVAGLLLQTNAGPLFDTVQYSLREVVRNVVEHSESPRFGYCGQYWPSQQRVQIGLIDRGVGLKKTLSTNARLAVATDRDAVQIALMPGVSRKGILPQARSSHDPWANSGFGLYMTSRLCSEGGSFVLLSGSAAVELKKSVKHMHAGAFSGTALQLELDLAKAESLSSRLAAFREEGIRAARTYFNSDNLTASAASTMLSRNFQDS